MTTAASLIGNPNVNCGEISPKDKTSYPPLFNTTFWSMGQKHGDLQESVIHANRGLSLYITVHYEGCTHLTIQNRILRKFEWQDGLLE